MARQMALVGKPDLTRRITNGNVTRFQKLLCFRNPGLDNKLIRRFASGLFEQS
jgi:hypothetical protein